jgi:hypothetical protein
VIRYLELFVMNPILVPFHLTLSIVRSLLLHLSLHASVRNTEVSFSHYQHSFEPVFTILLALLSLLGK